MHIKFSYISEKTGTVSTEAVAKITEFRAMDGRVYIQMDVYHNAQAYADYKQPVDTIIHEDEYIDGMTQAEALEKVRVAFEGEFIELPERTPPEI